MSHARHAPAQPGGADETRPGWPEVGVGLLVFMVVGYGGGVLIAQAGLGSVATGLIFTALSGVAGLAGFAAAARTRRRAWRALGVRPTTRRWLLIGAGVGLVAFVAKGAAVMAYMAATGDLGTPQDVHARAASAGRWRSSPRPCSSAS